MNAESRRKKRKNFFPLKFRNVKAYAESSESTVLTDDDVTGALDPTKNVKNKKCIGGTSEEEITRQLANRSSHLCEDQKELKAREESVCDANKALNQAVDDLINSD